MREFKKAALTAEEQIKLLIKRGLIVKDKLSAANIIKRIGYYRLSSYMRNFQIGENHLFNPNTTFKKRIGFI